MQNSGIHNLRRNNYTPYIRFASENHTGFLINVSATEDGYYRTAVNVGFVILIEIFIEWK